MMTCSRNTACRYCGSADLAPFLDLGRHPPSDAFIRPEEVPLEVRYPLEVFWCRSCTLVQLLDVVPPQVLFGDYAYLASASKALRDHYAALTRTLCERFGVGAGSLVVDIGCNDGIMLDGYGRTDLRCVGIEPSTVADIAAAKGYDIVREFFSPAVAADIVARHGQARIVTATNVFPHVDDVASFATGVARLLADDGVFVIEASYLRDVIDDVLFDTIYHEHLCYVSLTTVVPFLARCGLQVFDAERIPFGASGGAIRIFASRSVAGRDPGPNVTRILAEEEAWGVRREDRYLDYARRVSGVRERLLSLLGDLRGKGTRIGGYGAPAKGNTLLNYLGLDTATIECIAETNERKMGRLTPGTHIPVVSEQEFLSREYPLALLLTWNYLEFFLAKSPYIAAGGRFIVPLPEPRIVGPSAPVRKG